MRRELGRLLKEDVEREDRLLERVPERSVAPLSIAQRDLVEAITNGVLEGIQRYGIPERHREEGIQRYGIPERHREEMVDAVTNIRVDPPDLQPILDAIARVGHGGRHEEMLEAITNIVVDPPDLSPILSAIRQLDLSSKHNEMLEAVTNIVIDSPDLTQILRAMEHLNSKHAETLKAVTNIAVDPPDLTHILRAMEHLNSKHAEMLKALTSIQIEAPDFSPILKAIAKINPEVADLTPIARELRNLNVDGRHSELLQAISRINSDVIDVTPITREVRNLASRQSELLQAVNAINTHPDFSHLEKMVQELRAELRQTREDLANVTHRDVMTVTSELRHDFDTLRQEIQENRQHARSDAEALMGEIKTMPQVLGEIRQALRKLDQKVDFSEVLQHVHNIKEEVDLTGVMKQLKRLEPDHQATANIIIERLKKVHLNVDQGDLLQAIKTIKGVDNHELANAVCDRLSRATLNVNNEDVLKELRRYGQTMSDIDQLVKAMEVDFSPVTDAIAALNIEVDHTPVMSEMRKMKVDYEEIAGETHERLEQSHAELLQAVKKLNVETDLTPIISAISSAEVDFSPIHEAIKNIDLTIDHTPLIEAIRRIKFPDHEDIADTVHDRLRKSNLLPDLSEVLREIRNTRAPDFGPVLEAINSAEIDLSPVHEAVKRIQVPDHNMIAGAVHERLANGLPDHNALVSEIQKVVASIDHNPVLQAVANLRAEILTMRGMETQLKVAMPTPTLSPRLAVQSLPMPLMTMMPSPVASTSRALAPVSTSFAGEPKLAGYMREAKPDPLLRSMEHVDGRTPTRQYIQKQPSPQVLADSTAMPTTYKVLSENGPLPTSYATQVAHLQSSAMPHMQPSAQPMELIDSQSPPFPEQVRSISYQPATQAPAPPVALAPRGSACLQPETPPGTQGAVLPTDKESSSARDTSPMPRRASSSTPMPSTNSVRGPPRRPF